MKKKLPDGLAAYRRTPVFTEETVPAGLLRDHNTKAGVWGLIHVESGTLRYVIPSAEFSTNLEPDSEQGIVEPEGPHHIKPLGPVRFFVEFWR